MQFGIIFYVVSYGNDMRRRGRNCEKMGRPPAGGKGYSGGIQVNKIWGLAVLAAVAILCTRFDIGNARKNFGAFLSGERIAGLKMWQWVLISIGAISVVRFLFS